MKSFVTLLLAVLLLFCMTGCGDFSLDDLLSSDTTNNSSTTANNEPPQSSTSVEATVYNVGDTFTFDGLKVTFDKCEEYKPRGYFEQEKYKVIRAHFSFENTGSSEKRAYITHFACFADNSAADDYVLGEERLPSAKLSPGRSAVGYLYFQVPINASNIELEYEYNYIQGKKVIFKAVL